MLISQGSWVVPNRFSRRSSGIDDERARVLGPARRVLQTFFVSLEQLELLCSLEEITLKGY